MRLSSGGRGEFVGGVLVEVEVGDEAGVLLFGVLAKKGDSDGGLVGVVGAAWCFCQ